MLRNRIKGINLQYIYIGTVSLVKEYDEGEKVLSSKNMIITGSYGKITCYGIRKIVFALKEDEGIDLSYGLNRRNSYSYKVIDLRKENEFGQLNVKNNTLIIDEPKAVGDILASSGFPSVVKDSDVKEITKILLASDKVLNIREHSLKLDGSDIFNVSNIEKVNFQAKQLYLFKINKIPIVPQEIEKVYVKHFK